MATHGVPVIRKFDVAVSRPSHQIVDSCNRHGSFHALSHRMQELGITNQMRGSRDWYYVRNPPKIAPHSEKVWITEKRLKPIKKQAKKPQPVHKEIDVPSPPKIRDYSVQLAEIQIQNNRLNAEMQSKFNEELDKIRKHGQE
jgi:hypothetical protein